LSRWSSARPVYTFSLLATRAAPPAHEPRAPHPRLFRFGPTALSRSYSLPLDHASFSPSPFCFGSSGFCRPMSFGSSFSSVPMLTVPFPVPRSDYGLFLSLVKVPLLRPRPPVMLRSPHLSSFFREHSALRDGARTSEHGPASLVVPFVPTDVPCAFIAPLYCVGQSLSFAPACPPGDRNDLLSAPYLESQDVVVPSLPPSPEFLPHVARPAARQRGPPRNL